MSTGSFRRTVLRGFFVIALAGTAGSALAGEEFGGFWEPWCARNYRSESYGLGIGAGFGQEEIPPSTMDERCYGLGKDVGDALRADYKDKKECRVAFLRGMAQGLEADILTIDSPSECSHAGYAYGRARLENAARRKLKEVAGEDCLKQYDKGYADAAKHLAPVMPSLNNRLNACYLTGYDDGALFAN